MPNITDKPGAKVALTFIDLFAGIGGFRLAMEMAGHKCLGHCEIDKFANMSYAAIHKPKEDEWLAEDITKVRADEIPVADCWCFGFPCQDISVAGKGKGFKGNRSSLFFAVTRHIRDIKEENKPSYLLIENVKNLLSINGGFDFTRLLIEMDEIGYDAEWDILNSSEVVPQNRERIFIVGHLRGRSTRKVFPIGCGGAEVSNKIIEDGAQTLITKQNGTVKKRRMCACIDANYYKGLDSHQQRTGVLKQVRQIGNVCPTKKRNNPNQGRVYDPDGIAPCLNKMEGGNRQPCIPVLTPDREKKRQNGRRFKTDNEPMFTLTSQDRHGIAIIDPQGRKSKKCTPTEIRPTLRAQSHGNLPCVVRKISENKRQRPSLPNINRALKANKHDAGVYDGVRIRKLTPRECWRLQGFPDWAFERAAAVNSDSQLYKQAGNAVTIPVVYEIAKRI